MPHLRPSPRRFGGSGDPAAPVLVFAHANGYPPEAYRLFLSAIEGAGEIWTVEHRPLWGEAPAPLRLPWQRYADDMLVSIAEQFTRPVWLVGHSMGGVCSLLAAAAAPERIAGLIALDPVLLTDGQYWMAQTVGRLRPDSLPMVRRALNRPHEFDDHDAAFAFYRGKRAFRAISDEGLRDYVMAGHQALASGGVRLRWSGAWEACVYRSAPRVWPTLGRLACPTLGIFGSHSDMLSPGAMARWQQRQPDVRLATLEGGHLIPLEAPSACAALVSEFLPR